MHVIIHVLETSPINQAAGETERKAIPERFDFAEFIAAIAVVDGGENSQWLHQKNSIIGGDDACKRFARVFLDETFPFLRAKICGKIP